MPFSSNTVQMRRFFLVLALAVALPLQAAEARKYAVVSLIGDKLMIAVRDMATGSSLDQNAREYLELSTPALDNTALLAAETALTRADPGSSVLLLAVRDPAVFAAQARMLEKGAQEQAFLDSIARTATAAQATHLVLIAKQRREARLKLRDGFVGSGWLEGVGFYVDRTMALVDYDKRESHTGFLAPFAYFRVVLIELASGKVLAEQSVMASTSYGKQESLHPWDVMTSEEKVATLQRLIRDDIARVVPALVSR